MPFARPIPAIRPRALIVAEARPRRRRGRRSATRATTTSSTTARALALVLPWTLSAGLAACGGDASFTRSPSEAGDLDGPDVPLQPQTEPLWTAGSFDGEDWEIFGVIGHLAFNDSGDLFVLDTQAGRVVVLDRDGNHLRTISQQGDGPGELGQPRSMSILADGRLGVLDMGRRAIQFFTQEGEYLDSTPFDLAKGMPWSADAWLPDGSILTTREMRMTGGAGGMSVSAGGADEPGRPVVRFGPDGERQPLYTAWEAPPPPGDPVEAGGTARGGGAISMRLGAVRAFDPGLFVAPLAGGAIAVVDSVGYRIKLVGPNGAVERVLERPVLPIPVTEPIRVAERERRLATLDNQTTAITIGDAPPAMMASLQDRMKEARRTGIDQMTFAEQIPAIADLAVDETGRLWVERAAPPGDEGPIDLVTADGRYLGTVAPGGVRIPVAFGPNGLLAYSESHEMGYATVRVVRLVALTDG